MGFYPDGCLAEWMALI